MMEPAPTGTISQRLRQRARISLLLTLLVLGFDLVGFRTNWLLPQPRFCGSVLADGGWREDNLKLQAARIPMAEKRICVREIIHPFSRLSGSATVALSVQSSGTGMQLYDVQFFIARRLGPRHHNDTPGDWIFLSETRFNTYGWGVGHSSEQVASWSSQFETPEIRRQIWLMVQRHLDDPKQRESLSVPRRVGLFIAVNGALIISVALVIYSVLEVFGLQTQLLSGRLQRLTPQRILASLSRLRLDRIWLGRLMLLGTLLAVTACLVVSRRTNWLMPRAFWCKVYAGPWQVCLHEIYYAPSSNLRMMLMGVQLRKPDLSSLYANMQFFTALPKDRIGFVDVPGSWHFQNRVYYDKHGWLQAQQQTALSSIVDPLMPRSVQLALWHDIAYQIQDQYKARRLSLQSKLLEVSGTYLFMLLTVLLATWTALNYLEIWILSDQDRQTSDAEACNENISTS